MANWVCNKCTARMPVGSRRCPEPSCRAVDAHEEGGDTAVNVFTLADDEVAERLGLVPGDPGARDSSTDPVPVEGEQADFAGSAPTSTRKGKNVSS